MRTYLCSYRNKMYMMGPNNNINIVTLEIQTTPPPCYCHNELLESTKIISLVQRRTQNFVEVRFHHYYFFFVFSLGDFNYTFFRVIGIARILLTHGTFVIFFFYGDFTTKMFCTFFYKIQCKLYFREVVFSIFPLLMLPF